MTEEWVRVQSMGELRPGDAVLARPCPCGAAEHEKTLMSLAAAPVRDAKVAGFRGVPKCELDGLEVIFGAPIIHKGRLFRHEAAIAALEELAK